MSGRETLSRPSTGAHGTTLEGILERVTYVNEENAWSVVKLNAPTSHGQTDDLITMVANLRAVQPGEEPRAGAVAEPQIEGTVSSSAPVDGIEGATDHSRPTGLNHE